MNMKTLGMAAVMAVSSIAATGCSSGAIDDAARSVEDASATVQQDAQTTTDAATNWFAVRTWFARPAVVVAARPVVRTYATRFVTVAPRRVWVPGHYAFVAGRRVFIAGHYRAL
ncbi:MAG TPA: hypothetical protein VHB21_07670 [Minicystis sp.]|nr:hypothetical protein [Minicystis sp.]